MVSLKTIAELYRVSTAAVNKALNGHTDTRVTGKK